MKVATAIPQSVSVVNAYEFEGQGWLEVPIAGDYESVQALPAGLHYRGRDYGQTGWNSDRRIAYYTTGKGFAIPASRN
jgi:hypothetical protein